MDLLLAGQRGNKAERCFAPVLRRTTEVAILRRTTLMFTPRALHDVVRDKLLNSERQRHRGLLTSCDRQHTA